MSFCGLSVVKPTSNISPIIKFPFGTSGPIKMVTWARFMARSGESIKLADEVDFEARQVEADVKIQPVEDETRPREERAEFGEREEGVEPEAAAFDRGEE